MELRFRGGLLGPTTDPVMKVGRALGRCIDLDGALILVPMMRGLLTRVRTSWFGRLLPIDGCGRFDRLVGHVMFALAILHSAAFAVAYANGHARAPVTRLLFTAAGLTGAVLLAVFAVMWTCSLPAIRRSQRFELFYFTHLLYVAWLAIALVHARAFVFWVGVPLLGFVGEQVRRLRRRAPASMVVSSAALRSGVTRIEVARPPGFQFQPGDYAFVNLPAVAAHEWHPFTISSSPERPNLGIPCDCSATGPPRFADALQRAPSEAGLIAHIDGPYGSPSAEIFRSRNVVLIGAGIGVTPFASVLETLVLRANAGDGASHHLRKIDFVWMNRDQYAFEWFRELLGELERLDRRGLLDIHLFMTGARTGATSVGLGYCARGAPRGGSE